MPIALILLDLNGVLYRYDRAARIARLAALTGAPPGAILRDIWDSGFEDQGDAGALDAAAYLGGFGARMAHDLSEADWLDAQIAALAPIEPALALLARLRPGVHCAVLTNNNLLVRRHFALLYPELAALVGGRAFVSAEFAARKPDPDVYRRCLLRIGVAPGETLFIDDSAANVAGARQAGLLGHHATGVQDLEAAFARFDVLA